MSCARRYVDCVRKTVESIDYNIISTVLLVYAVITSAAGHTQAPVAGPGLSPTLHQLLTSCYTDLKSVILEPEAADRG